MDAASLKEYLKREFGIESREEFETAVEEMKGVNLGIFTVPLTGGTENDTRANETDRCIA